MAAAAQKSILVRVCRTSYSDDVKKVDDIGEDGYDLEDLCYRPLPMCSSDPNPDPDPIFKWSQNDWFVIEPTADSGVKISQIFSGLRRDHPLVTVSKSASVIVGSNLYEIGGGFDDRPIWDVYSGVQRLDIQNQSDGWKFCGNLNFSFQGDRAVVFNQYIYMFGVSKSHFAYVYNTIKQKGYIVNPPPLESIQNPPIAHVWAPVEGHGMLVLIPLAQQQQRERHPKSYPRRDGKFYLHDPDRKCWKFCEDYEPIPFAPSFTCKPGPSSVLNGILYILDRSCFLHAYHCKKGKLLYTVKLPNLYAESDALDYRPSYYPSHMVAVSDSILYVIGHYLCSILCARVLVSSGPPPSAELLGVQCFGRSRILSVLNCVPVDASLAQIAKNPPDASAEDLMLLDETRDATSLDRIVKDPMPLVETRDASLGRIAKNPFSNLDETRAEDKLAEGTLTVELSGNYRNEEDISFQEQKAAAAEAFLKENEAILYPSCVPFLQKPVDQPPTKNPPVDANLGQIVWNPVTTLDASPNDSMLLDETREDIGEVARLLEDASLTARLVHSKKSPKQGSALPMFPVSKRLLHQPRTKKLKRGLSKPKLPRTPMNPPPPSDSTNQSEDDGVRMIHIPVEMKLKRHQEDMTDLGNDSSSSSEGQG